MKKDLCKSNSFEFRNIEVVPVIRVLVLHTGSNINARKKIIADCIAFEYNILNQVKRRGSKHI